MTRREISVIVRAAAVLTLFSCWPLALAAENPPLTKQEQIRIGQPFPALPADAFTELHGFPPTARELEGRVFAIVQFQSGQSGEYDEAIATIRDLMKLAPESHLIVFGVATCFDTKHDALSLDDAYIKSRIAIESNQNFRVLRDHGERFCQRLLVRSRGGMRRGSPAIAVIESSNRVLYTGFLGSPDRREMARRAVRAAVALALSPTGGSVHMLLEKAVLFHDADKMGDAWKEIEQVLADEKSPEAAVADAGHLMVLIELRFDVEMARVEEFLADGRVGRALEALAAMRKIFAGCELSDEAEMRRSDLESDEAMKVELAADRAISAVLEELESRDQSEERVRRSYASRLNRLIERHAGTQSAERARAKVESLEN